MIQKAGAAQPLKRARAPTITVDTSALNEQNGTSTPISLFFLMVVRGVFCSPFGWILLLE
jgi:hypothetical protein